MCRRIIINSENNDIFALPQLPSGNKNCGRTSNAVLKPPYPYLSESGFLFRFTAPNKQLHSMKSVLKSLEHVSSV